MEAIGGGVRWFLRSGLRWAILALLIVAFLWFVPQLQGEYFSQKVPAEERPALVNEYRRTWAQIIGGFGLLLGLYFTWRRVEISQDQQVTERFTRAIDQLGATDDTTSKPRLEVRLGGIYALERIAWDSPRRDYSTVMEVLTAYIRENSPQAPGSSNGSSDAASTSTEATAEADEEEKQPAPLTNYLKTLLVGYHLRYSRKEEVPICPKTRPHRSRLPLYGEYPMSCGSSSNRSSKSTIRQSAPVVRA
jgi:hypothetical protein